MTTDDRRKRGEETIRDVYAGDVVVPTEGYAFTDIMLETLFAEVWTRDILSMRDKRIMLLGMIAAQGETETFKIQVKDIFKCPSGHGTGFNFKKIDIQFRKIPQDFK